jgi:hypothetical protein
MLTILIEAEGKVTCINSNRDGPHSRHGFHKGVLALWDSHKTCVISGRILRTVSAGSLLLKVKRKRLDYCHPPPGNMGSTTALSTLQLRFPINGVVTQEFKFYWKI